MGWAARLGCLIVVLSGCAPGVDLQGWRELGQEWESPRAVARTSSTPEGARASEAAGPLSLERCIEIALARNPELTARGYDVAAAGASRDAVSGLRWPSVRLQAGYTAYSDEQRLVPPAAPTDPAVLAREIASADAVVSMPLYTGGRLSNDMAAADLLAESARERAHRAADEVVFGVTGTFYGILGRRRVVESLEFSLTALEEHRKRVESLVRENKAARVDLLRTEVRLADVNSRLAGERNALGTQERLLATLMGLDHHEEARIGGALTLETVEASAETSAAQAFASRPDYLAAKASVAAQHARVASARGGALPTVTLQGSYGARWAAGDYDLPAGADGNEQIGRVGIVVDIPVFEGGRISARAREEQARLAAAEERLRRLSLEVRLDVETAILDIASARERAQATGKAIEQAAESLRIEREKYDLGKGTISDVLDAQSALLDSQTNHYRALAEHNIARARLRLATGRKP